MTGLFSITTFFSSFLLFSIQLIVGKKILPWFGGNASVWTGSMLFFTLALFFGYLYVNQLTKYSIKKQVKIHLSVIVLSLINVVINYLNHKSLVFPNQLFFTFSPILQIPCLILFSVGLPFFLLSSTSTLLQYWFTILIPKNSPYFIYVISNIGSLLGLLTYPFLIESKLSVSSQEMLWLIMFCFYIFLITKATQQLNQSKQKPVVDLSVKEKITASQFILWLSLSIISNIALLAFTSNITQSVSPVPLLWIAPLAIFLLSYIIAFSGSHWYNRNFHGTLMLFSIVTTSLITTGKISTTYWFQLGLTLFTLFTINLVCHAELFRSKPNPKTLVPFYTAISLGGVVASILCAIIAPIFFHNFYEFPLSLILASLVITLSFIFNSKKLALTIQRAILSIIVIIVVIFQFNSFLFKSITSPNSTRVSLRNFYGVLTVSRETTNKAIKTTLFNGTIVHGSQESNQISEFEPTTYYTRDSGVGLIIKGNPKRISKTPLRIGVIGLGAGTLSGYCLSGDYFRFYEINPAVIDISYRYFSYLSHCQKIGGVVDIIRGDARLSLELENKQNLLQKFDVLVVDAFTDDSIPVHLITKEAISLYLKHLAKDGVLAFHISNHYLNLADVLDQEAYNQELYSYRYETQASQWYFISATQIKNPLEFYRIIPEKKLRTWTDDFSNIFQILK